ncbi:OsmC family protein [Microbulbifer sp. THAF38]|uniref:OsmC family protein n=1 Tax=Microbulbifer sp. THAF38 TaxID=2587856 RepID=UPI0012683401|nr:OsmC family protein [Microbulbifer sp. THAF38]QFT55164.1 OsmC-like protein [Microbulbifer sp. THAF38]
MEPIEWDMSSTTIVRKLSEDAEQATFPPPHLDKVKQGELLKFHAHINVEQMPQGHHLKKATIFSNVPNGGTWELICDEGTAVGGRGSAPSPIMYFSAGLALCMMSHVEMLAQLSGIHLKKVKLEQKTEFSTTLNFGGIEAEKVFGKGERVEIHLMIESDETEEKLVEFAHCCRQACMSLQTVANATPVTTSLYLNSKAITFE